MSETKEKTKGLKGPGLLWVGSKIKKRDLLDWSTFLKWYDNDMLPPFTALKGVQSAVRSTARDQSEEWPTLCLFAVDEFDHFNTPEFEEGVPKSSTLLPGSGNFYDYADFDCRFYEILSAYDTGKHSTMEATKCFLITLWDFRGDITEEEFEDWYKTAHHAQMTRVGGFLRTTRYKLHHSWWSAGDGAELPCPDHLEICEFDTTEFDVLAILEDNAFDAESTKRIMSKVSFEISAYKVEKLFGDRTLFHGFGDGK